MNKCRNIFHRSAKSDVAIIEEVLKLILQCRSFTAFVNSTIL